MNKNTKHSHTNMFLNSASHQSTNFRAHNLHCIINLQVYIYILSIFKYTLKTNVECFLWQYSISGFRDHKCHQRPTRGHSSLVLYLVLNYISRYPLFRLIIIKFAVLWISFYSRGGWHFLGGGSKRQALVAMEAHGFQNDLHWGSQAQCL